MVEVYKRDVYKTSVSALTYNLDIKKPKNRVEFACGDNSHMESFFATLNKEFYRPSFLRLNPTDSKYKYITPRIKC